MIYKDTLIYLEEHSDKANKIVDLYLENSIKRNYSGVLNICGVSGSAKTEIANLVHRRLYEIGISSHVVNLDKFYRVNANVRKEWRERTGYVGHEEIDWVKVERELQIFDNNDIQVLIIEGLYASYVEEGLTFFIEGRPETFEDFRKLRGKEEEDTAFRQSVVAEEYADILRNTRNHDYTI